MAVPTTKNSVLKKLKKSPMKAVRSIKKAAGHALKITKIGRKFDSKVSTEVLEARLVKMISSSNSDLLDIDQAMYGARLLTPRAQRQLLNL